MNMVVFSFFLQSVYGACQKNGDSLDPYKTFLDIPQQTFKFCNEYL